MTLAPVQVTPDHAAPHGSVPEAQPMPSGQVAGVTAALMDSRPVVCRQSWVSSVDVTVTLAVVQLPGRGPHRAVLPLAMRRARLCRGEEGWEKAMWGHSQMTSITSE